VGLSGFVLMQAAAKNDAELIAASYTERMDLTHAMEKGYVQYAHRPRDVPVCPDEPPKRLKMRKCHFAITSTPEVKML
jgi:hypothetical protein